MYVVDVVVYYTIAVAVRVGTQLQRHRSLVCESLDELLKGTFVHITSLCMLMFPGCCTWHLRIDKW